MVIAGHVFWFIAPVSEYSAMVPGSGAHYAALLLRCLFTGGTDIFLMISGVFFLSPSRNISAGKIWGKNILKMASAYVLWKFLYAWADMLYAGDPVNLHSLLYNMVHLSDHHLWYIPMMIGIYMIAPLSRVFTAHAEAFHYRYLFVIMGIASALNMYSAVNTVFQLPGAAGINLSISRTPVALFSNFFMLSILGYWFYSYRMKRISRALIYFLGLLGIASMFICEILSYKLTGTVDSPQFLDKFVFGNLFKCSAVFLFLTTVFEGVPLKKRMKRFLAKLSNATLFIYLSHWMIIQFLASRGWLIAGVLKNHQIAAGFIYVFVAYICGALFSFFILQKINWKGIRNRLLDRIAPNRRFYTSR